MSPSAQIIASLPFGILCGIFSVFVVAEYETTTEVLRPWQRVAIPILGFASGAVSAWIVLSGGAS